MSRRSLCLLLWFAFGGIFLWSLPQRFAHLDDAWLGEQAYRLAHDGVVRSELFRGFLGYEERIFVFHKLFIPQGALAIDWLGWSRASLKVVSLPWFLLTLGLFLAAVRAAGPRGREVAPWAGLLLVAHPLVVDYSFAFRPEVCLSTFGLASFLCLRRGLQGGSRRALAGAGLLAGLAFLVHMNGLVFIAAGAATLAVERRWRAAAGFSVLAGGVAALYGLDAWLAGEWPTLVHQFRSDPSLDARDFSALGMLAKLAGEPARWFQHGEDVALTLLTATFGTLALRAGPERRARLRPLVVWVAAAVVVLGLTAQSKTPKYALPLVPQLMLLVAAGLARWPDLGPRARRAAGVVALLYLATCASRSVHYFTRNSDEPARHAALLADIDPASPVVADLTFVFDELERHTLRGLWAYRVRAEARGETFDLPWLVEHARADGVRHLVLDLRHSLPRRIAAGWPESAAGLGVRERATELERALRLDLVEPGP